MAKDYKAGLIVGLVLVIIMAVWLSIHPSLSVGSRLDDLNKHQEPKPDLSQIIKENGKQENSIEPANREINTPENEESTTAKTNQNIENGPDIEIDKDDLENIVRSLSQTDNKTIYHTVEKGDTVWGLSKKFYETTDDVKIIVEANPHVDVYDLKPGTTLIIPPRELNR